MTAPRLDRRLLAEQTYEWIKQLIYTGKVAPGERLSIDEIAARLGVSRTPVRDALHRLAFEGLTIVTARRGTSVSGLSLDDIRDVYAARRIIEPAIAEAAAVVATPKSLDGLQRIQSAWERLDPEDIYHRFSAHSRYAELDVKFHEAIAAMIGNGRIEQLLRGLAIQRRVAPHLFGSRYRGPARRVGEHREILDALKRRDGPGSGEAMRKHLAASERDLVAFLERGSVSAAASTPAPGATRATRRGARAHLSA